MASQSQQEDLRHCPLPQQEAEAEPYAGNNGVSRPAATITTNVSLKQCRDRGTMSKCRIRSLLVALSLHLSLTLSCLITLLILLLHGTMVPAIADDARDEYRLKRPDGIVGLDGVGRGRLPQEPQALPLYLAQLGLSLAWHPIMFKVGANWLGLAVVAGLLGTLVGCYRSSRNVNPIAGDLVMLCLAWAALLSVVNLRVLTM